MNSLRSSQVLAEMLQAGRDTKQDGMDTKHALEKRQAGKYFMMEFSAYLAKVVSKVQVDSPIET